MNVRQYLIDYGWTPGIKEVKGKKVVFVEDRRQETVSSMANLDIFYQKDGKELWWGLCEAGFGPRWCFDPERKVTEASEDYVKREIDNYLKKQKASA